jgi:hypothetical protein
MPRSASAWRLALKSYEVPFCRRYLPTRQRPPALRAVDFISPQQALAVSPSSRPDISDAICRRNSNGLTGLLSTS